MHQNLRQHPPCMAGYNERLQQDAWRGRGLEQKKSLLKQCFEGVLLIMNGVK